MYFIWVIMMNLKVRGISFTCLSVYSEIFLYMCPSYLMTEQLPVQLIALRSSFVMLQVSPRAERNLFSEKFMFITRESSVVLLLIIENISKVNTFLMLP